ncbi:hypothetical protein HK101_001921 [Irineochytrium annulatum]|nr:hypothetical protein HK101_001921 [Irineochytrium annulatum]
MKELKAEDEEEVAAFKGVLYDGVMEALVVIPGMLDLRVRSKDGDGEAKVMESAKKILVQDHATLEAEKTEDFTTLVKFVTFFEAFVPRMDYKNFNRWMLKLSEEIMALSRKNPLVSGFYKLFAVVMRICVASKYFDGCQTLVDAHHPRKLKHEVSEEKRYCFRIFSRYFAEISSYIAQFKDELLASLLQLILAAPIELVVLDSLSTALKTALKLGLSYTPLAAMSLDKLEDIVRKVPAQVVADLFAPVLPVLLDYLMTYTEDTGANADADEEDKKVPKSRRNTRKSKYKKQYDDNMTQGDVLVLNEVRVRVLKLIGSMGGIASSVVDSQASKLSLIAWTPEKRLKFKIPFRELRIEAAFDDLLPRLVDLAENTPDRQAKIASCELLHSIIIWMTPYHEIYERLFPVILRLSVDIDTVTRDLFKPTTIQLIHWLTSNYNDNPEMTALLSACFDAVSDDSGSLRQFAAECLVEFYKWSIKHLSDEKLKVEPATVISFFGRVYAFCQHSSHSKRLGASLLFNKIYTIYRENDVIVDQFSFEVTYNLLLNLRSSQGDQSGGATVEQAKEAIDHMVKILVTKSKLFEKENRRRRDVPGLEHNDLSSFVAWLFEESAAKQLEYTQKCIEVFDALVKCSSFKSASEFLASKLRLNPNYLPSLLEKKIKDRPPSESDDGPPSLLKSTAWLQDLQTCNDQSTLVDCVSDFLARYGEAFNNISGEDDASEVELMGILRPQIFLRIFELAEALLRASAKDALQAAGLWSSTLFKELARAIVCPSVLGFSLDTADLQEEYVATMARILKSFEDKLPRAMRSDIVKMFAAVYASPEYDLSRRNFKKEDVMKNRELLRGLRVLLRAGVLAEVLKSLAMTMTDFTAILMEKLLASRSSHHIIEVIFILL